MNLFIARLKVEKVSLDPTGIVATNIRQHLEEKGTIDFNDVVDYIDDTDELPDWEDQGESEWLKPGEKVEQSTLQVYEKGGGFLEGDILVFDNTKQVSYDDRDDIGK